MDIILLVINLLFASMNTSEATYNESGSTEQVIDRGNGEDYIIFDDINP